MDKFVTGLPEPANESGVIAASVYALGRRVADIAIDEAGRWSRQDGHVVWIGLLEPSQELLRRVQAQLDLHPLAIEDAGKAHQHPKLEQYGDALFIVARTAQVVEGRISFGETHIFVGRGYVVSVRLSRQSRGRSMILKMACSIECFIRPRSIVCTCSAVSCCACESQSLHSSMFATGWSMPKRCPSTPRCNLSFGT